MNLEDHLGDVLRKARMMQQVSPALVAQAAGITEAELASLEDSGQFAQRPDFAALARLLHLNLAGLESHLRGWRPTPKDLSRWRQLRMFTTDDGGMAVNCYLVWDEATGAAALFDTGWNARVLQNAIQQERLQLQHIFITHSHHDHVAALGQLRESFPAARVHAASNHVPAEQRLNSGEVFSLGGLHIAHRPTPGHAEDGTTFVTTHWPDAAPPVAIVGDAVFAGSMGGAPQHGAQARQAVREQILSLPPATLLGCGHGPLTTVAEELQHNPFFPP